MANPPVHFARPYILLCIIIIIVAFVSVYVQFIPPTVIIVPREATASSKPEFKPKAGRSLFLFNPNTIDSIALDSLDLPRWIKKNMMKYRQSGGIYRCRGDIRALYGMNDSVFARLEPYIDLVAHCPAKITRTPPSFRTDKRVSPAAMPLVELNNASPSDLIVPRLIGQKRSESIIKYRNRLGGFYSVSQLAEIYSIGDSILPLVAGYFTVDTSAIMKMNLRDQTWKSLVAHPYIDSYLAKHILQAQKISPHLISIKQLSEAKVIDSATYSKLKHYFN